MVPALPSGASCLLGFRIAFFLFFFQAEDGIRVYKVTGVQTCALPISMRRVLSLAAPMLAAAAAVVLFIRSSGAPSDAPSDPPSPSPSLTQIAAGRTAEPEKIGRASCRDRGETGTVAACWRMGRARSSQ